MTDGSGPSGGGRSSSFGGNVPRRLSYASVASGAHPHQFHLPPGRSGALAHLVSSSATNSSLPSYQTIDPRPRRPSGNDSDSLLATSLHKPTSLPAYSRKFANIPSPSSGNMPSNSFFIPSYLRHSRYVARLESAHKARLKRERELPSASTSAIGSLSTSAGNTNVHRMAPSHRGMTYDIIESNPPKDEDELLPLPSRWNEQDKYPGLDIDHRGMTLKYNGSASKADIEAASVRADFPMSPACGIYYFEVLLSYKSKDCAVAVGFSTAEASLERLPGWESSSWGYHGDDGKMFFGEQSGRTYGPTFGHNDVVGCGINFNTGQAFFTLNGQDLGICFRDLKKDVRYYPTVGMKKNSGSSVTANFGRQRHVFDIDERMDTERETVMREVSKAKTSALRPPRDESSLIQELVAQFLAHDGYVETAKAFAEEIRREKGFLDNALPLTAPTVPETDDTDAVYRQKIRRAILSGDINQALEVTQTNFPSVLVDNPDIVFRLKCRKWVEMISKTTEINKGAEGGDGHTASNGHGKATATAADNEFVQDMELDEHGGGPQTNGSAKQAEPENFVEYDQLITEAMLYGQELQREYRDEDGEYARTLQEIFSLVAYNDPKGSVHGHLLDPVGRTIVAEELNSAILVSLGRSPSAALENAWKQAEVLIDGLSQDGGPAAFVNLQPNPN
ncbi:hypothetical protein B0A52_04059 [Exophiala mesophila]|uniref:Protein FYV10 n=1 Tax=Exophiala mesophila TaxID=212818 RepID=A0A438NA63_EXOME|nr:hypothetical protein B0A52_04059 [Exophiala mesophila]